MTLDLESVSPESADYRLFLRALTDARLPIDDVDGSGRYFMLRDGTGPVAFGGLEGSGPDQMIRSIVTSPTARGRGYGKRLVEALVQRAAADGVERLWLLTTSAESFFSGLGWEPVDRERAPEVIRTTRQFAGLCPSSAVLMCRRPA